MPHHQQLSQLTTRFQQRFWQKRRVWLIGTGVAVGVVLLRALGLLQSAELGALDQLFRSRLLEATDDRIVIVGIDDTDINQVRSWPIPDGVMAELLAQIRSQQPRAIGLDIYRDLPVKPGQSVLQQIYKTTPNLIGIEKIADSSGGVRPPRQLDQQGQVGFNNVLVDGDGKVRRALLYWTVEGQAYTSFALALALRYLELEGIKPQAASVNPEYLQLGQGVFHPFQPNDGGYVRSDNGGYQILSNFHHTSQSFRVVSMREVLSGKIDPQLFHNRIVLIGSTAVSLKDSFYTPLGNGLFQSARQISGVELHAHFIRQILDAALEGRSLLRVWAKPWELLWILGWSWVGAVISWKARAPGQSALSILLAAASLTGVCYAAFLAGWWLPLVPPLLTLAGSSIAITSHMAHLKEELNKSKEFLNSVINTIPDPIFVKNREHRWIVLNDAYCRFIGHPLQVLLDQSDYDFFPAKQAALFWQQDDLTFNSGVERESEEEFTDASGITYSIATKRSLHRDAAGNLFLVGVIRDITQRKQIEEELRRTAADLVRSNAELRLAEDRLRRMAYHDPLTGLPNRKLMQEHLMQAIERAENYGQLVALLFLDLDGFKQINDCFGHMMGDLLLKAVAQRLIGCLRGSDTVARLGGDEFVVLLSGIPTVQDVTRVADKIIHTLSQNFVLEGRTLHVTTSVGVSIYPLDCHDMDSLLTKADAAMYRAKQQGKNRREFFHTAELSAN